MHGLAQMPSQTTGGAADVGAIVQGGMHGAAS
jgi:hypothetical protein